MLRKFPAEAQRQAGGSSRYVQSGLPWWYDALALAYPDRLEEIIAAVNSEPPPMLRVDGDREAWLRKWKACALPRRGP